MGIRDVELGGGQRHSQMWGADVSHFSASASAVPSSMKGMDGEMVSAEYFQGGTQGTSKYCKQTVERKCSQGQGGIIWYH